MRRIVAAEFITLDGVIQAPGGADEDTDGGFAHGGWTIQYWHDDIGAHFQKYVVSTTLQSAAAWRNSILLSGPVVEEVRKLKEQAGKDIMIDGSSVLLHTLIENDLVDQYLLHVYPLVLGGGKRLFPEGKRLDLKLSQSTTLPTGVHYQRYEPDREGA